jgi:hypothetical protein
MVVNSRAREINRDTRKLTLTSILIIYIYFVRKVADTTFSSNTGSMLELRVPYIYNLRNQNQLAPITTLETSNNDKFHSEPYYLPNSMYHGDHHQSCNPTC